MKRIVAIFITIICILSLASCGGKGEAPVSNRLDTTSQELAKTLPEKIDLSEIDCLTEEDALAENLLIYIYGVDESLVDSIDSYFLTNSHRSTDARAIAVIFFKDVEDVSDKMSAVQQNIRDIFLKNLVNTTANYDPEQSKIASSASFKLYENALVFVSYDTEGNTAVFDAIG